MEVTVNLPENVYRNVSNLAKKSNRKVVDLIVDVVEEKYSSETPVRPLADASDEEVLSLAKLEMPKEQSERHSELLYKNQAGTLSTEEKLELDFFQQIYGVALARKAEGIYEAIRRNLIKTPADLKNE